MTTHHEARRPRSVPSEISMTSHALRLERACDRTTRTEVATAIQAAFSLTAMGVSLFGKLAAFGGRLTVCGARGLITLLGRSSVMYPDASRRPRSALGTRGGHCLGRAVFG